MPVRRSMADYQERGSGGIIFMAMLQALTIPMSYEERRIMYRGMYSVILAKIEEDPKYKEDTQIGTIVGGVKLLLDQAGRDYRAEFEAKSFGKLENQYCELLAQIFDGLTQLVNKTKMIEKQILEQEVFA